MSSPKLTRARHSALHAVYTVTTVLRDRQPLFTASELARIASRYIQLSDQEGGSQTYAWVVMPDHIHWLFALTHGHLSVCVARFKSRCARAINLHRGMSGPVWQSGFYDHQLRNEEDLRMQARYIIANPIRAGLVTHMQDYPYWGCRWVSHASGRDAISSALLL